MSRTVARKSPADRRKPFLYGTVALVIVAIIVAVAFASRQGGVPQSATSAPIQAKISIGQTAPEFKVDTDAGPFDLASVPTPVLLELFATWCPHCQRETVVMNQLATQYAGKLAVLAVTASPYGMDGSTPETQADVNTFGQTFGVKYPLAFDPTLGVAKLYLQSGYPTLVLIGKDKKIDYLASGEQPAATISKAIDKAV